MHKILSDRAAELARLATTIRFGLAAAEALIPIINVQLDELAALGVVSHQVEGPGVYARPAGVSNDANDDVCIYQAMLLMPGGIGGVVWSAEEYSDHLHREYGEQRDLRGSFMPYGKLPAIVRALIVKHADKMVASLLRDIRVMEA